MGSSAADESLALELDSRPEKEEGPSFFFGFLLEDE